MVCRAKEKWQHYAASEKLIVCPDIFTSSLWPLSWVVVLKSACIQQIANGLKVKQAVDKNLFHCLGGLKVIISTEGLTFVLKDTKCGFFWTASDLYAKKSIYTSIPIRGVYDRCICAPELGLRPSIHISGNREWEVTNKTMILEWI